jgi:hypothetical protein
MSRRRRNFVNYESTRENIAGILGLPAFLCIVVWGIGTYFGKPWYPTFWNGAGLLGLGLVALAMLLCWISEKMEHDHNRRQRWLDGER